MILGRKMMAPEVVDATLESFSKLPNTSFKTVPCPSFTYLTDRQLDECGVDNKSVSEFFEACNEIDAANAVGMKRGMSVDFSHIQAIKLGRSPAFHVVVWFLKDYDNPSDPYRQFSIEKKLAHKAIGQESLYRTNYLRVRLGKLVLLNPRLKTQLPVITTDELHGARLSFGQVTLIE